MNNRTQVSYRDYVNIWQSIAHPDIIVSDLEMTDEMWHGQWWALLAPVKNHV